MSMIGTINEDEFFGDDGNLMRKSAVGDPGVTHETKPAGYGTLLADYEWRQYQGQAGTAPYVRAWCLGDARWMDLTLKVDPRYGKTVRKGVEYAGTPVQAWQCFDCGTWTVK